MLVSLVSRVSCGVGVEGKQERTDDGAANGLARENRRISLLLHPTALTRIEVQAVKKNI